MLRAEIGEEADEPQDEAGRGNRRKVRRQQQGEASAREHDGSGEQTERQLVPADAQVERRAERTRSRPHRAESNERGDLDDERRRDRDGVQPARAMRHGRCWRSK